MTATQFLPAKADIPAELVARPQWVAWRGVPKTDGKLDKIPVNPTTGRNAATDDPSTWSTFDEAIARCKRDRLAGVGYVFCADDPFCGVDFDNCINKQTSEWQAWAFAWLQTFSTYAEISPSESGVKIFARGTLPGKSGKRGQIEMYDHSRFFTVTGRRVGGMPLEVADCTQQIEELYRETFAASINSNGHKPTAATDGIIHKGEQHYKLTKLAGAARRQGATAEEIEAMLLVTNETRLEEPAPPENIARIAQSIARYDPAVDPFPLTDYGNAERLVAVHGDDLRYCHAWGKWLVWDDKRWKVDATAEIERRAKQTVRAIYGEAAETADETTRKAIAAWAQRSESRQRIDAMIDLAKSELGIPVEPGELNRDPWLLTIDNGTLELRAGTLREHRRSDLITMLAPVSFDATARGERWQKHSEMFLPNVNIRRQVQRDLGKALVGATLDESIAFWHGGGANGKTTTSRAILRALGDYADRAAPNLLIQSKNERHPTEIADLCGKRVVFSVEVDQGKHLAEALVKDLTGGDRKKARFMYGDFFSFEQTFSMTLIVNHKPIITSGDTGIWRRVRLIPWEFQIPDAHKRPQDDVLEELAAEDSAILTWLLAGLRDWQQDRSWVADEVKAANDAYRAEMDVLGAFMDECCIIKKSCIVAKSTLYESYTAWAAQASEEVVTKKTFTQMLRDRGIGDKRGTGGERQYVGVGLKVTESDRYSVNSPMSDIPKNFTEDLSLSVTFDADVDLCAECHTRPPAAGSFYCEACRSKWGATS